MSFSTLPCFPFSVVDLFSVLHPKALPTTTADYVRVERRGEVKRGKGGGEPMLAHLALIGEVRARTAVLL
jgi:hypothetical protein